MKPADLVAELHRRQGEMYADVDGSAELGGETVEWRTAGVYRVEDRVREVWLVPLDLDRFDRIWLTGGEL